MGTTKGSEKRAIAFILVVCMIFSMAISASAAADDYNAVIVAEWRYYGAPDSEDPNVPATSGMNMEGAFLTHSKGVRPDFASSSLRITDWRSDGDKFWMIAFPSENMENLAISLIQRASLSGPRDFKMEYSTDGLNWSPVTDNEVDIVLVTDAITQTFDDFPLPPELNDLDMAYIRLRVVSDFATSGAPITGGSSNINNIVITGTEINPTQILPTHAGPVKASPASGAIEANAKIALTSPIQGALIKYKLNGADYVDYQGPFSVTELPAAIEAYAVMKGLEDSEPEVFHYTLDENTAPVTVAAWSYNGPQNTKDVPATSGINAEGAFLSNFKNDTPGFSSNCISVVDWRSSGDKFWMMSFSCENIKNMTISLVQRSSGAGPRDFKLEYSTDGLSWSPVTNNKVDVVLKTDTLLQTFADFPLPPELNGLDMAYIRLRVVSDYTAAGAVVLGAGSSGINNIVITGTKIDPTWVKPNKVAPVKSNKPNPGMLEPGAEIALTCATQDALIKYEVNGAGYTDYHGPFPVTELPAVITAYAVKDGFEDSDPVTFRYTLSRTISGEEYNQYRGQIHSHTSNSDGVGTYEDAYTMARDKAGLDFFSVTDHSNSFDNASNPGNMATGGGATSRWADGMAAAEAFNEDGSFAALYGYEMTWNGMYGHMNTYRTSGYVSMNAPGINVPGGSGLQTYYNLLEQYPNSINQFNHPGEKYGDFLDFSFRTDALDKVINLIEVGNSGNRHEKYYDNALARGWHLAPTNNQDNHQANWGLANDFRTVVLAKELTRESIYDALRNMRCYSAEDKDVTVDYRINGMPMGTILGNNSSELIFSVTASHPQKAIGTVSVITKDGAVVASEYFGEKEVRWDFALQPEYDYYYIRIVMPDGKLIITAPIWTAGTDATELEAAIEAAEAILLGIDAYTPESVAAANLEAVLAAAKAVDTASATQEEINAAANALINAMALLVEKSVDKSALENAVAAAEYIESALDGYYAGTERFIAALENARLILNDPNATQADVDAANEELLEAQEPDVLKARNINATEITNGNGQADIAFPIISANGKGYTVYITEINDGAEDNYAVANANFNSKGAHVKGLTNGRTYRAYIVYESGNIYEVSNIVTLMPGK